MTFWNIVGAVIVARVIISVLSALLQLAAEGRNNRRPA